MDSTPQRRFWQIHLSTAIVLMFVAGGLIWINVQAINEDSEIQIFENRGWPFWVYCHIYINTDAREKLDARIWSAAHVVFNVLICSVILFATAIFIEYVIHRREARKP